MHYKRSRLLLKTALGLLTLLHTRCFAQIENVSGDVAKEDKLTAEQNWFSKWDYESRNPGVVRIERALHEVSDANFTDIPLSSALEYLEQLHHVAFLIDQNSLANEGISIDQPVILVVSEISLSQILRLLLEPLKLDYVVKNDVLLITSKRVAEKHFENRVYMTNRIQNISAIELKEIITSTVDHGRWNVVRPCRPFDVPFTVIPALFDHDKTIETPAEIAGDAAPSPRSICNVGNMLIIHQTCRIHEEIVELLDQLDEQQQVCDKSKLTKR